MWYLFLPSPIILHLDLVCLWMVLSLSSSSASCLFQILLLFSVHVLLVSSECGISPPDWSASYDFSAITDQPVGASDGDTYGFNPCQPSQTCEFAGPVSIPDAYACIFQGGAAPVRLSSGPGQWSLIDDNNFMLELK